MQSKNRAEATTIFNQHVNITDLSKNYRPINMDT